jgi:uncharacterized protein (TIRG00374 family)
MNKTTKSILQFVVLLGIGILLIWLSLKQVAPEKDKIISSFKNANYFWVGIALLIAFMSHALRAYRWNYLLEPLGHKVKFSNALCHVIIGYFANYGIPRMGEVTRCTLATKYDKVPFESGFGTVITERIIDFALLLIIFFLTLIVQYTELINLANKLIFEKLSSKFSKISNEPMQMIVLIGALVGFVVILFLLRKKITNLLKGKLGGMIKGLINGLASVFKTKKPFQFLALSFGIWLCYFYALYFCFFALTGTSHLGHKECLTLLLFGTFGVIFSPGGLGAYPAIVGGILAYTFKVDLASSFALPWLVWSSQFLLIVILGIIALIILPIINSNKNVVSPTIEK